MFCSDSPIFRWWNDSASGENSTHLWTANDGTSLQYTHYSEDDSSEQGVLLTDPDTLQTGKWNYIAISFTYGEGTKKLIANVTQNMTGIE